MGRRATSPRTAPLQVIVAEEMEVQEDHMAPDCPKTRAYLSPGSSLWHAALLPLLHTYLLQGPSTLPTLRLLCTLNTLIVI